MATLSATTPQPPSSYSVKFSTYLGGTGFDSVRDVAVDLDGNIIIVGGTGSTNFPVTAGCYQPALKTSTGTATASALGDTDVFIAKMSPAGQILWATYFGGPGYDRAYAVEVDNQNRIVISGRAGPGFPTTAGVFQPSFISTSAAGTNFATAEYGDQNAFVACFTTNGSLVWSTYAFYSQLSRDVAVDDRGDIYITSGWNGNYTKPAPFTSGYRKSAILPGGVTNVKTSAGDSCVIKLKGDGSQILWGSWLCGSGSDGLEAGIRVNAAHEVYYCTYTPSTDMPFNPADHGQHTYRGGAVDLYLAKLSADGNTLIYGTYLGGNSADGFETHEIAIDAQGNCYVQGGGGSTDIPTTPGVYMPTYPGAGAFNLYKVGLDGAMAACTYLGGASGQTQPEGLQVDDAGNVYMTGSTYSTDLPVTAQAYQAAYGPETNPYPAGQPTKASNCGYLTILSADFKTLLYSTYFGQGSSMRNGTTGAQVNAYGAFHSSALAPDGSFLAVGSWLSPGLPLVNAVQTTFGSGPYTPNVPVRHCDATVTRFVPNLPGSLTFSSANYTQTEGKTGTSNASITVKRIGGSYGAVGVSYATSNGTATAGSDYAATSGTLSWADGDAADKTFAVTVSGDTRVEPDETVNLSLMSPIGGAAIGAADSATLTILNDDFTETYDNWATSKGLTGPNALPDAILTWDHISNLAKYALGLDPNSVTPAVTNGTVPGLPWITLQGGNLTMVYQKNLLRTDITYLPQYSADLRNWNTAGISNSVISSSGNVQTNMSSVPMAPDNPKFMRLQITKP